VVTQLIQLTETPLVRLDRVSERARNEVYAKLENTNPTGSHKDRESLAIIRDMLSKGAKEAVIASTGNAAISLSALAPCEGIKVNVFVSRSISRDRLELISTFSPKLHVVDGSYYDAVRESEAFIVKSGGYDCNPGRNRHKLLGDSVIGRELLRQLKESPDWVVVPSNNGTLISGVWQGIREAKPRMVAAVAKESKMMDSISGYHRLDGEELDQTICESHGKVVNIDDKEVSAATIELRMEGVFCEPAAAASLAAFKKLRMEGGTAVLLITGSAFKFIKSYTQALNRR
jgi:threonine synthase